MVGQFLPWGSSNLSLDKLEASAGVIFSGTVLQIERVATGDGKPEAVRVSFRVDQAVRGCSAGDTVAILEWAELWLRGDRYRIGEQVIIFLHSPGLTGLSSPVAGEVGIFPIGPSGLLRTTPLQAQLLAPPRATSPQSEVRTSPGDSDRQITHPRLRRTPSGKFAYEAYEDNE